jgi:hypothetical protein
MAYAVHIHGQINYLKLRGRTPRKPGEPAPQEIPYEARDVQGDVIGCYFPEHLLSLTAPGLHILDTVEYQSPKAPIPTLDTYCQSQSGC